MDYHDFFPENEVPLEKLIPNGGFCGIFRTIGCVGDSLSSGEFQTKKADGSWRYNDMFEYSWGQFMARTIGSTVYNFSKGGMTAKKYMESFAEEKGFWDPSLACQAYIIALGANDVGKIEMGSVSDIKEDYRENADTFAGHYAAIIQRLKEIQPGAKFFLMTMPARPILPERDALLKQHAALIHDLAAYFSNCYVIDLYRYAPENDDYYHEKFWLNGHLSPCGYILSAQMIMSYIDYIIRHNMEDFKMVGYIGKEHLLKG